MKKIIAFILSVVLAFSCCAVMAMAEEPVYYSYDGEEYEFVGELTGKTVKYAYKDGNDKVCYELNAKEAGIYKITISRGGYLEYGYSVFGSIDKRNIFYNEKELTADWSYDETYVFINMEENEKCYIAIGFYPYEEELKNGKAELNFTYSGNIKDVYTAPSIKEKVYEDEDGYYYYSTAVIVMNNDACYVDLYTESDKILNSVKFDFDFTDKSYSETVDVVSISKYVKSIELPKDFEPSYTLGYPDYYMDEAYPEYVKISFKDGTSVSVEPDTSISLPGIDYVEYYVYTFYDDGKLVVNVAGFQKEFDATVTKDKGTNTIKNILTELFNSISNHFRWLAYDVANLFPNVDQVTELFRDFGSTLLIGIRTIGTIIEYIAS